MMKSLSGLPGGGKSGKEEVQNIGNILEKEANSIYEEDLAANHRMGELGAVLFPNDAVILTHCNAGSLATSGWGTALGVIRAAFNRGKLKKVLVDETRPYLQGARLTAWELKKDGIPYELITDNMAAHLMKTEKVDAVIVGSDRISGNGDVANKIGTYGLAVLCRYHQSPFYVAAPTSTIDLKILAGEKIPIEERSVREVTHIQNLPIAPLGAVARHPAFDVTPRGLITAIITERGIARPPSFETIKGLFNHSSSEPAVRSI
jgi:methylthioribose-1-phosphate isomerase